MRALERLCAIVRPIASGDRDVLTYWAEKLRPQWGECVREELEHAEYRVGAFVAGREMPVAFAGITPLGSPDGVDAGAMWFVFLFIEESYRGCSLQEVLCDTGWLPYVRAQPLERRVFMTPIHRSVVAFAERRGWVWRRALNDGQHVHGVYELLRTAL